jgi:hypothetical protein
MSQYIEQRMNIILDLNNLTAQTLPLHELTYHCFIFLDSGFWEQSISVGVMLRYLRYRTMSIRWRRRHVGWVNVTIVKFFNGCR